MLTNNNVLSRLSRYNSTFNDDNLRNFLGLLCSDYGIVDYKIPEKKDDYYQVDLISEVPESRSVFYFNHDRYRFINVLYNSIITEIDFDACLNIVQKNYQFNESFCIYSELEKKYSYLRTSDQAKTLTKLSFKHYTFDEQFKHVYDFKEQFDYNLNYYADEKSSFRGDYRLELLDDQKGKAMYLDKYHDTYVFKPFKNSDLEDELTDIMLKDVPSYKLYRERK